MNTEATYSETSSRNDPRAAMASGDGEGARGSSRRHPPIRTSLVRALTAPWRLLARADYVVVHKTDQECCNIDDSEWLGAAARRALAAERVDDLSDLLADFEMDMDTIQMIAADGDDQQLGTDAVDRNPIAYLYARRVAQQAGVTLADDAEATYAYESAREACERVLGIGDHRISIT